jgi:hypothetical protein
MDIREPTRNMELKYAEKLSRDIESANAVEGFANLPKFRKKAIRTPSIDIKKAALSSSSDFKRGPIISKTMPAVMRLISGSMLIVLIYSVSI